MTYTQKSRIVDTELRPDQIVRRLHVAARCSKCNYYNDTRTIAEHTREHNSVCDGKLKFYGNDK